MSSFSFRSSRLRHLRHAGLVIAFVVVAVVTGWALLAPASLRAKTLSRTPTAARDTANVARETVRPAATAPRQEPATPSGDALPAPPAVEEPLTDADVTPGTAWPATVTGRVVEPGGRPAMGASIVVAGREVRTAVDGTFTLPSPPPGAPLLVKLAGHGKVLVSPTDRPVEVQLERQVVRAAYLTYYGFAERAIRARVLGLVERTELNAVVIDVKGDRGWVLYPTEVPLALAIQARGPATNRNFDAIMADFKARGVYTIARIVVFKDNILANARPDLAVMDTVRGKPWVDRESLAWVDPFREAVWDYNIALAREAVQKGFDEVQFDYVRFPTDGKLSAARYARAVSRETRVAAIAGFLERARAQIGPLGGFVAADIFGYTAFNENDTDIGQRVEDLAPHVDYLSPMVYPSGYHLGIPGHRNPVANPYKVVHESVRLIRKRANGHPVQVRPWLQDFRDYAFDRRAFGPGEVRLQIKAADDAGGIGWMLWNPRNDYTAAALRQKGPLAAR